MHRCIIADRPKIDCPNPDGSCVGCRFWKEIEPKVETIDGISLSEVVKQLNQCKEDIVSLRYIIECDAKRISDLEWKI